MRFTTGSIMESLAGVLQGKYPDYPVYDSPNQQGTDFPCFFIFFMPSTVESQIDERFYRDFGIDIVFVQQRNIVNGNKELHSIAEFLDEKLELFQYEDGSGDTAVIRTFDRQWKIEDGELHYQFHIRQRVSVPRIQNPMQEMEENNASINEKGIRQ